MDDNLATPRWLFDIKEKRRVDYGTVKEKYPGKRVKYGIVSYTWGRWIVEGKTAENSPDSLEWKVPYVKSLPLTKAYEVLSKMEMQYVWWDWMCVPQDTTRNLTADQKQIAGEEIAKQMDIYKGAAASMVWLHTVEWSHYPLLASFLAGNMRFEMQEKNSIREVALTIEVILRHIQKEEPWLTSGWTLQEGVLLPKTALFDANGSKLLGDRFPKDMATVADISNNINSFVTGVGQAFVRASRRGPVTDDPIVEFILDSKENYRFMADFLAKLIRSGLSGYCKKAPLFILAGKASRKFSRPEDHCWALLGALEIQVPNPQYNEGEEMDAVYSSFFTALLREYQWFLFLIGRITDEEWRDRPWARRIGEGHALPLEVFFGVSWLPSLPLVTLDEENPFKLILGATNGECLRLIDTQQNILCRRYQQTTIRDGFVEVDRIQEKNLRNALFLPIAYVEDLVLDDDDDDKALPHKGFRCIEIEKNMENQGMFHGVTDVWSVQPTEPGKEPSFVYTQVQHSYTLF